jgi:Tol biopolymer transport system component
MRAFVGALLAAAVAATAVLWLLPVARARSGGPSPQAGGIIAFGCDCDGVLPRATIVWSGGRVRIRGDVAGRWSPDGRWFAFGGGAITLQSVADATVTRQLTHPSRINSTPGNDGEPAWFPSGKRLVFVRGPEGTPYGALWTVGSDGHGAKRLYAAPASAKVTLGDPDVSHDGRRIAFDDSNGHLWVTGRRGLTVWRLGPAGLNGFNPRWSPDDTRIAFLDGGQTLAVLDLRTNKIHDVGAGNPSIAPDGYYGDSDFSWSPNGRYLAGSTNASWECDDPTGPCTSMELWIVNPATGVAHLIYQTPEGGSIVGVDWHY